MFIQYQQHETPSNSSTRNSKEQHHNSKIESPEVLRTQRG